MRLFGSGTAIYIMYHLKVNLIKIPQFTHNETSLFFVLIKYCETWTSSLKVRTQFSIPWFYHWLIAVANSTPSYL